MLLLLVSLSQIHVTLLIPFYWKISKNYSKIITLPKIKCLQVHITGHTLLHSSAPMTSTFQTLYFKCEMRGEYALQRKATSQGKLQLSRPSPEHSHPPTLSLTTSESSILWFSLYNTIPYLPLWLKTETGILYQDFEAAKQGKEFRLPSSVKSLLSTSDNPVTFAQL